MRITLNPAGKLGEVEKVVTIETNDPRQPEANVSLRATVLHGADLQANKPFGDTLFAFSTGCRECHATPAGTLRGAKLYAAICQMCHGSLAHWEQSMPPTTRTPALLSNWIAEGRVGTGMAGYSIPNGGPLTRAQIDSLVTLVAGANK